MTRGNSHRAAERRSRRKTVFLEALVDTVNVTLACRRAGIARCTAYDWREADARFARKWDDVIDEGGDLVEAELHKRAYRAMFERVWAHSRKEQDQEAAAWARDYPPTPMPADWE